ncbi:S1C family serine protease [Pseudorhodoplanes sp.]|uniref:S1C family serine protease n=1 Tax=Pseudorhodoplanes sp. TaxID=1934341 RepID=UPI0039190058
MRMSLRRRVVLLLVSGLLVATASGFAFAQGDGARNEGGKTSTDDLLSSVVRIKTYINPDGRTVDNLGQERDGSGIVIDDDGLILTIGYLMVEAHAAEAITNDGRKIPATVVGYDHDTGFGLLKAVAPLKVRPMLFGNSSEIKVGDPVLAASFGGRDGIAPARVVSRREFAGTWEYLVDNAIYTAPAHSHWSGAALITRDGKLVGVGSLIVNDAAGNGGGMAGNLYIPTDLLKPILADLIANGSVSGKPKPWIGLNTQATERGLVISRVTPHSPAEKAGLRKGDLIVNVGGDSPKTLPDFYRKLWSLGEAGTVVPLNVDRDGKAERFNVQSINRMDHLKLKSTF